MDNDILLNILNNPGNISESDLENLEEIIATYPYCQLAHMLIAKYTQDHESMLAPQKIRKAASYAYSRNALRKLIHHQLSTDFAVSPAYSMTSKPEDTKVPAETTSESHYTDVDDLTESEENDHSQSFFDLIDEEDNHTATSSFTEKIQNNDSVGSISDIVTSSEERDSEHDYNLSEAKAMALYYEGKEEEAIATYKKLAELYPEKKDHYYNQLAILTGDDFYLQSTDSEKISHTVEEEINTENAQAFFENIEDEQNEPSKDYENINEGKAMALYYEGKEEEAMAMYYQLIEMYPERKEYYEEQISIFGKDKKNTEEDTPTTPFTTQDTSGTSSFFEGIEDDDKVSTAEDTDSSLYDGLSSSSLDQTPHQEEENKIVFPLDEGKEAETKQITKEENNSPTDSETTDNTGIVKDGTDDKAFEELKGLDQANTTDSEEGSFFDHIQEEENNSTDISKNDSLEEDKKVFFSEMDTDYLKQEDPMDYHTENQAILLFNQGKSDEAIAIYEDLIRKNPQRTNYYKRQIEVLKDMEYKPNPQDSVETGTIDSSDLADHHEASETLAIQLFNDGKTEESIKMYEQLIEIHPEKQDYYMKQIDILRS